MEAASLPPASTRGLVTAPLAGPLDSGEAAAFASRLALGLAAGLIAVLVPGEAGRLSSQQLTWRSLLGH